MLKGGCFLFQNVHGPRGIINVSSNGAGLLINEKRREERRQDNKVPKITLLTNTTDKWHEAMLK